MSFTETRFLLSSRTNPHSAVRSNGVRFWGYPERVGGLGAITCVGIHTAETAPTSTAALAVAGWQATAATAPSSYHVLVDSATIVRTLEDVAVAFHIVGLNTRALGLSFATRAALWGQDQTWDAAALRRAAWVAAKWCDLYAIPLRWLTKAQAEQGVRGFIRHSVADPGRRSDPGAGFPAGRFFTLVRSFMGGTTVSQLSADAVKFYEDQYRNLTRTDLDANGKPRGLSNHRGNQAMPAVPTTAGNVVTFYRGMAHRSSRPGSDPYGVADEWADRLEAAERRAVSAGGVDLSNYVTKAELGDVLRKGATVKLT